MSVKVRSKAGVSERALKAGSSEKGVSRTRKRGMGAGRPQKQAVAIAWDKGGRSKYADGGFVNKRFSPIARPQRFAGEF